ncbi:MAG: hypothetical protein ACP5GX_08215 [Anaerolineae bacterium]
MDWTRTLTARQRFILIILGVVLIAAIAFMAWTIVRTMRALPQVSPLPTPTLGPPTSTPTPAPPTLTLTPSPTPRFETSEAGTIAREVTDARGLVPRWETPLSLVDLYDMSVALYRRYEEAPPFPLSERGLLEALDLWPETEAQSDPVAQSEDVAALYFPEEGQLYLRRDWSGSSEVVRRQVAYGYARALPEQYGDLQRLRAESSLDQRLALEALARGDALISLWLYAGVEPGTPAAEDLLDTVATATLPRWRDENPLLEELARLPLDLGVEFASGLYATGGLPALDEAVLRPPRATSQILHPPLYIEGRTFTALDPIEAPLDNTWQLTVTQTVGEALMDLALVQWSGDTLTTTVMGWNGDLLQVWEGPEDSQVILWQTAWQRRQQAEIFAREMVELLPERVRWIREEPLPEDLPMGLWWEGRLGAAFLRRYVDRVWLVWGDDVDAVRTVAAEIP